MTKKYKCPYCEERHEREKLITHIEDDHEDMIPENQTPTQVVFNSINKKTHGTCVVCKKPTKWNEKAGRYDRLCENPKCREKLREDFKTNSLSKHGTYNFTADPKFQEKMLKGRKISSTYKFTDGGKVDYVGSYEKKFLEFVDKVIEIDSKDIIGPGPIIEYEYNGEIHHWITDFYYVPGNLVLDIKDGGKNPNTRPMKEYREKQVAKETAIRNLKKYNYLRLTDNNFVQFMEVLADLKYMALDLKEKQLVTKINEGVSSTLTKDFKSKGKKSLSSFKKIKLSKEVISKYKNDFKPLKHIRETCEGYLYLDNNKCVAILAVEDKGDSKFIQAIEINKEYQGYGLSKQLLSVATNNLKATRLSVNKSNEVAISIYKKYGFKTYKETDAMLFMSINESNIQELSAAMSTVPPMYSSDASVLISVDNRGDERIALSSLDFNDKLLLDDELDGIIKITKEKFKEKYTIKEQFLVKKDEAYYNLLKAFKNKDACIYEGIYRNLSSFDTVLTENQIYFDNKFIKVEKDKVLEEMTNRLSKVNESIFVIGESTFIRNDKLELDSMTESDFNINEFYNELKVELEGYHDGVYMITPSTDKEDLDDQYHKFNAQNDDQKDKADTRSFALYGMNNYDHYHILLSKLKKGTEDDELNGLEYNRHDEEVVKESTKISVDLSKEFNSKNSTEVCEKIKIAKEFNTHTLGRAIVYPTENAKELESLYMKYMALNKDDKASSDNKSKELFGKTNREIYQFIQDNIIKPKNDEIEGTHSVDDEENINGLQKQNSVFSNDTPLLTPKELNTEVHEDYSCFNDKDGDIIKKWRNAYIEAGQGIIGKDYRLLNLDRINILRKSIYENNIDAIIQCGWLPNVEFNSENRVKASELIRDKMDAMIYSIKAYNDYIEESDKIKKPKKCTKCGSSNIGIYIQGEPIFKCNDCGKFLGVVPFHESYIEETTTTKEEKKAISIVLVSGNSWVGKTIKKVQGIEFSHAAISLDEDVKRIYSFNNRNGFNGLSYESMKQYVKDGVDKVGVYTFLVTDTVYKQLENVLDNFNLYRNKTKYSILNLLTIPFNIDLDLDMKMVCSEFVDKLLKTASLDLTNKKSSLVSPKDFYTKVTNKPNIVEVFNDHPKNYNSNTIKERIQKIKKSNLPVYEFVEYESTINEAKSLPIQFDSAGNLIIKNIRKIDFEQEYADSHRLLIEYDKSKSYEPMKFELAKMQFLITLMEKKIYKKNDKELVNTRARYLNDFKKYLKVLTNNDRSFNFTEYYQQSPFNDAMIQIDKNTLKYGWKALKYIITK